MEKTVEKVIDNLKIDSNLLALFFVGKYSVCMDLTKTNDVDILAVYKDNREFEREIIVKNNINFDVSFINYSDIMNRLSENNSLWINICLRNKLIFSKKSSLFDFLYEKIENLKIVSYNIKECDVDYIRYKLHEFISILYGRKADVFEKEFLINVYLYRAIKYIFELNSKNIPSDKKLYNELKKIDEKLFEKVELVLKEGNILIKIEYLDDFFQTILKEYGGYLKFWKKGLYPIDK
ncbi:hypothetical protein [Helicovermis profundi]|uniref:Polymerase beta nucleotidyltransferase domain-containing protein n=1 Tax=Helicovermis profundi TaxID=3065157 RepID=A0AAU9ETJ8_9FIRM|nr:hypothetical protein HLPR_21010 [Clostridia bacterium S502]